MKVDQKQKERNVSDSVRLSNDCSRYSAASCFIRVARVPPRLERTAIRGSWIPTRNGEE